MNIRLHTPKQIKCQQQIHPVLSRLRAKIVQSGWVELRWVRIFVCDAELAVQSQRCRM